MLVNLDPQNDFEIVIGIVAPIGTNLDQFIQRLHEELTLCAYTTDVIRLSRVLDEYSTSPLPPEALSSGYYKERMDAGDSLRSRYGSGDAVAAVAIAKLRDMRPAAADETMPPQERRHAWILRTIKHQDEVALLRATYGSRFVLVGIHQLETERKNRLKGELADANPGSLTLEADVTALVERDNTDPTEPLGQHVREAFSLSDYFLDADAEVGPEVARFVGLLFGKPFITPTRDEFAMYVAFASSLRSADPGRQVGAVIASDAGDIIATGTNEVPKPGGGEYWPGDPSDSRDFQVGHDFNRRIMQRAQREFLDALADLGHLSQDLTAVPSESRMTSLAQSDTAGRIKNSRISSLIEFGRIMHAEMSAITQAARAGHSIAGSSLYTTAFPCHMCMRLIIGAGITRVVYVDPYPKSLAFEMYPAALGPKAGDADIRVAVNPFRGTAWRIYGDVFRMVNRGRNQDATFQDWDRRNARMRLAPSEPLVGAELLEAQVAVALVPAASERETLATGSDVSGLGQTETADETGVSR